LPKNAEAFLDSSVVISREFGFERQRERISSILSGKKKISTTYILKEINQSLVKDAVFLHSLMSDEMDLSAVFKRLQQFPLTERKRARCLLLLSRVTNRRQLRVMDSIARLGNLIVALPHILLHDVSLTDSGTECPLANERAQFSSPTYSINTSCTNKSPKCNLERFLILNRNELEKIREHVSQNASQKSFHSLLKEIINNEKSAKGKRCGKLGDAIICLDSPKDCPICSTNLKDFIPICESLGRDLMKIE
jgi:hypothetical protein